ncbi:MAG: hypothetical protein HY560_05195 [Gemmatimonadetes bacterium]|nr:hypothetical protein [Gemmatimonadota bacterium]
MTLGQFAVAVGAPPRWVQNARAALRLKGAYTEPVARALALARELSRGCGMPLVRAFPLAQRALREWPARREYVHENDQGTVRLVVDLERFLSDYAARLSLSRTYYAERRRGRPRKRVREPIAAAKAYGVDITLLEENLKRTPEELLRDLDENVRFLRALKVAEP